LRVNGDDNHGFHKSPFVPLVVVSIRNLSREQRSSWVVGLRAAQAVSISAFRVIVQSPVGAARRSTPRPQADSTEMSGAITGHPPGAASEVYKGSITTASGSARRNVLRNGRPNTGTSSLNTSPPSARTPAA